MVITQVGSSCYYLLHRDEAEVVKISVKVKNGKHWQRGKILKFLHAEYHILVPTMSHPRSLSTGHWQHRSSMPHSSGATWWTKLLWGKRGWKRIFFCLFFPVPFLLREVENKAQQETYNPTNLLKMDTKPQAESELHSQCYFFSLRVLQSKVHSNNFVGIKRHKSLQN